MDSEFEVVEERLKTFLGQLQTEFGILDRIVYKNKNQHRRCSYFQYLLKVGFFFLPKVSVFTCSVKSTNLYAFKHLLIGFVGLKLIVIL